MMQKLKSNFSFITAGKRNFYWKYNSFFVASYVNILNYSYHMKVLLLKKKR